jgi:hypothetical protein
MSTTLSSAKTILEADATLVALATGGIFTYDETGRMGIGRSNTLTSGAFESDGRIKPCLLIKVRSSTPFGNVADDAARISSARDMLEVWAYQDAALTTLTSMLDRVYTLLQGQRLGGFSCRWAFKLHPLRDIDLDAFVERDDYSVVYLRD